MSDYWLKEAARLQSALELEKSKNEQLHQYKSMVYFFADDYLELSYEKAQWQRDDWMKRCRKLISTVEYNNG